MIVKRRGPFVYNIVLVTHENDGTDTLTCSNGATVKVKPQYAVLAGDAIETCAPLEAASSPDSRSTQ